MACGCIVWLGAKDEATHEKHFDESGILMSCRRSSGKSQSFAWKFVRTQERGFALKDA